MVNDKVYIGLSTNIEKRWAMHRSGPFNPNNKAYNYPLYRAIRKYGIENFTFEILEECKVCELGEREIYYIAIYAANNREKGYNQDSGGLYARHGKLTEEIVEVIKERLRTSTDFLKEIAVEFGIGESTVQYINSGRSWRMDGETYPIRAKPIYNANMKHQKSNSNQTHVGEESSPKRKRSKEKTVSHCEQCGKVISHDCKYCSECMHIAQRRAERPEPLVLAKMIKESSFTQVGKQFGVDCNTIKKWCQAYGIPHKTKELVEWYDEQVGIISETPRIRNLVREDIRAIKQMDINTGEIINIFESASAATRWLKKGHPGHILEVCKGKRKSAYGYYWQFA